MLFRSNGILASQPTTRKGVTEMMTIQSEVVKVIVDDFTGECQCPRCGAKGYLDPMDFDAVECDCGVLLINGN